MKTMWQAGMAALAAVVTSMSAPAVGEGAGLAAQEPDEAGPQIGCFRGRPLPACKTFWLIELQGYKPLAQTTRTITYSDGNPVSVRAFEGTLEWNAGHMINLTPSFAVGGLLSIGPRGGSGAFAGLKARARHWLSEDLSVELTGGLLEAASQYPSGRGATADVRINIRDQGAFFVRWDGVSLGAREQVEPGYVDERGFQQAISIGAAAGSWPAVIGTGALGLGYVIVLGLFLANYSS